SVLAVVGLLSLTARGSGALMTARIGGLQQTHGLNMTKSIRWVAAASAAMGLVATTTAAQAREVVSFRDNNYSAGTVVVRTGERHLYYVLGDGRAIRYTVGVGRAGKQWYGTSRIDGKYIKPAWTPPAEVKRDKPSLPDRIEGGSPKNPMGAAALTLS